MLDVTVSICELTDSVHEEAIDQHLQCVRLLKYYKQCVEVAELVEQ